MAIIHGYIGTYTSPEAPGTYRFVLDTEAGQLRQPALVYPQTNTKYAVWSNGLLATVTENSEGSGLALLDTAGDMKLLDRRICEKTTACFLAWQDSLLYSANYHDGHVLIHAVEDGKLRLVRRLFLGEESGCHQVIFHDRWLLIPCLKLDKVFLFDREKDFAPAGELTFAPGTGPRHGVFSRDHRRFWLVSETSNQLFTYRVSGADFTLEGICPILPDRFTGKADTAAIRLSEDESTLYISVRGADLIAVFRLGDGLPRLLQHADSLGQDPWDILLVPGSDLLLTANRKSSALVLRQLEADGCVGRELSRISVPQCVGLCLE